MACYQLCGQPRHWPLDNLCSDLRPVLSTGYQELDRRDCPQQRRAQDIDFKGNYVLLYISTVLIIITIFLNIYRYI